MFVIIDGIDGSGKSTIIEAWKEYLRANGNGFFDLVKYFKETGNYPEMSELKAYEFIISGEPTYTGIGKILREELLKDGANFPPESLAEAFSLDRLMLYKKIIIPCLKQGKVIIQDRGISSTLSYQPLTDKKLTVKYLSKLAGNQLALKNSPNYLVLMNTKPEEAINRLKKRTDKQDDSVFEKLKFLKKLHKVLMSKKFQTLFTKHKTKIQLLEGNQKIDIMKAQAVNLLKKILSTR